MGHTIFNAIKKLFKTWIAFLLIVMVFGAVVGGIAGLVASKVSHNVVSEVVDEEGLADATEELADNVNKGFTESYGVEINQLIELVISGIFLFFFFLSLFNSKGMGDIFLPADVNLLFSAPLKPQTVMMFRLTTTLGIQILFSLFMIFQIPNLVVNLHMSLSGAISIFIAWIVLNLFSTLCQLLLYIISSYSDKIKKNIKIIVGAVLAVILALFMFNIVQNDKNIVLAAVKTFTGSNTYWVPFWGWIRGMCMSAVVGNDVFAYMFMAFNVLGIIAFIVIIWNIKVDFYEDALVSAERRAEMLEKAKAQKTGVVRTKERSDKIKRDGFSKGSGANVFFYKTLYNRKRLSYFGFLTKTMIVYAGIVVAAIVIIRNTGGSPGLGFMLTCGAMTFVAFYRTMGNPLSEDLSRDFFAMIPCSAKSKLFYSVLGGLTNTFIDIIVPYIFAAIWFKANVGDAIVWLLFLLAIDLYGTVVSAFIMTSVSISLPETVQKMVQIVFIYFGILPAITFVILGLVFNNLVLFMPFGIVMNLVLSFIFFMIIPNFLQNGRK